MPLIARLILSLQRRRFILYGCGALMVFIACSAASAGVGAEVLTGALTVDQVRSHLLPASQWHPFPQAMEREMWTSLPAGVREGTIREAEKHLHGSWPTPKATDFLGFVRTGNRSEYQAISFGRREQLATLVIAECIEGEGRFLDDIVNGIWTICEETYWGVPAHLSLQRQGNGLPDVTEPTVDLFAAETGSLLAWTYYLLKDSLDKVSPLVSERIAYEVDRRINTVNLERNDFWWMGLTSKKVNNWTPWICSNWLATVLVLEKDPDRRARSVYKMLECLDRFLEEYTDDGGCDEGPSYWGRAGGSLFDCLELVHFATKGKCDWYAHPRIREIGRFITRAHISGRWFVNFADAPAKMQPDAPTVYRYGKAIDDASMMAFGAWSAQDQHLSEHALPGRFGVLGRVLPALFVLDEMAKVKPSEPYFRDSWFPGIQVMTARSVAGSSQGLYLAAQGGHNDESHNHNDVGNFVIYKDGEPVIIDVGVETYTAKTFGPDRYSIWTMQSSYHNLPTINGVSQKEGRKFAAKDVSYHVTDAKAALSMEIAGAYPPAAGVRSWRRTLTLERGNDVVIQDAYELKGKPKEITLALMTCREPMTATAGRILLGSLAGGAAAVPAEVEYDPALFSAQVEPIDIVDPQLRSSWGNRIWRILLTMKQATEKNESILRIR
jgi:hypothetical protein